MTFEQYKDLKAKASFEGLYVGLMWLFSFAAFVMQFSIPNLSLISMGTAAASVVLVIVRLRRYRNEKLDELPYFKAFMYCLLVFFYASLVMALGQWIYFQYIDQGFLMQSYVKQLESPEFKELMKGVSELKPEDVKLMLEQVSELRAIDIAMQFLSTNIVISVILSMITAFFAAGKATLPLAKR